ncbi:MAG: peptidylprolyl isomerase, partial [Gemmatimonadota bacterium]
MSRMIALALALAAAVVGCEDHDGSRQEPNGEALMNPQSPEMNQQAPAQYQVRMETSAGPIVIEVHRDWAPHGADRFYNLVRQGYYDECRFFRVVPNFVVQWGMHGDPEVMKKWIDATIADDPVVETNGRGTVTFAKTNS